MNWSLTALLLLAQAPPAPMLEGSKLQQVPGPMAPAYPDPALGFQAKDIQFQIRARSRRARVPALGVPSIPFVVEDRIGDPAGWKAYSVEAPPGSTIWARLRSAHEGWFRVHTVNRWGLQEVGMLQNRIPTGNPEATFINSRNSGTTVYFLVDTTELGAESEPFRLEFAFK
jgi:hypothetical protein